MHRALLKRSIRIVAFNLTPLWTAVTGISPFAVPQLNVLVHTYIHQRNPHANISEWNMWYCSYIHSIELAFIHEKEKTPRTKWQGCVNVKYQADIMIYLILYISLMIFIFLCRLIMFCSIFLIYSGIQFRINQFILYSLYFKKYLNWIYK